MNPPSVFPKRHQPLSPLDFEFLNLIGQGAFSQVWLVRSKLDGVLTALKVLAIDNSGDHSLELSQLINNELKALNRLDAGFPFIVHLQCPSFSNLTHVFIPLEYVPGGDLLQHILRHGPLNEARAKLYVAEIACALDYLRSRGIIFRDLKPENILISDDGHLKLTDFGLSTTDQDLDNRICGTPHTIAPEVLRKDSYDHKVDWYSLGSCMFEMLTGRPPFHQLCNNLPALVHSILHMPIKLPKGLSTDAKAVLAGLLVKDPAKRIGGLSELLSYGWFESIRLEDLEAKIIKPDFVPPTIPKPAPASSNLKVFHPGTVPLLDALV